METIIREAQEANMLHGELGRTLLRNYEIHKGINWQQRAANAGIVMVVLEVTGFVLNLPASVLLVPLIGGVLFAVVFVGLSFTHTFRAIGIQLRPPPPDPVSSAAPPDDIRHADEDSQDPQAPTGPNNEAS